MFRLRKTNTFRFLPTIKKYLGDGVALFWLGRFFVIKLPASEKMKPTINFKVGLKTIRGKFYCFETIRGCDYSFCSDTPEGAQTQMKELIKKLYSYSGRLDVTLEIK